MIPLILMSASPASTRGGQKGNANKQRKGRGESLRRKKKKCCHSEQTFTSLLWKLFFFLLSSLFSFKHDNNFHFNCCLSYPAKSGNIFSFSSKSFFFFSFDTYSLTCFELS